MGKKRTTNKHLPPRVYHKNGAYFFVDKNNKWHRLGVNFPEAMAQWAKKYSVPQKMVTVNDLLDRYLLEVSPTKSKGTHRNNLTWSKPLRIAFGNVSPQNITPVDLYSYLDMRGSKVAANREKSLLSSVFSHAIRWGVIKTNPCKDVRALREESRDRYIEDWEFNAVKSIAPPFMRCVMDFAYLTGLRRGDILSLQVNHLTEEGIKIVTNKTKTKMLIEWTPALTSFVEQVKEIRRGTTSFYLFCREDGRPYASGHGFGCMWQRLMRKALKMGLIKERFHFHDIRRKTASDHDDIEKARKALGHTTQKMTSEYISGWQKTKPLK